jgi:hypothetical protein
LCSLLKFFEKSIIKQIEEFQKLQVVGKTANAQLGIKKFRSTATAGLTIQSLLVRALDNYYAMMSSLDLSTAFDVVNVKLLVKRLKFVDINIDVTDLFKIWLTNCKYYVNVDSYCSIYFTLESGNLQGSILSPFFYIIFVSPFFDLTDMYSFTNHNHTIRCNSNLNVLKEGMSASLNTMIIRLQGSCLKVNQSKPEILVFHHSSNILTSIEIDGEVVRSSINMLVLRQLLTVW